MNALLSNPIVLTLLTLFTVLVGGLLVSLPVTLPALSRTLPAFHPDSRLGRLERKWSALRHWLSLKYRFPELGGYVHDTAMSVLHPPTMAHPVTGTFTWAAGSVAGTIVLNRAAADSVGVITLPIMIPQNGVAQKGSYLRSVDIWYEVTGAALDAGPVATINKFTLPANGAAFPAASAQAFTYDAGNDTSAEADDLDEHKMTLTLTTPFWLDDDDAVYVQLSVDSGASSVFKLHGWRANYTLRL